MENFLHKLESEDVIIYTDQVYSIEVLQKCREAHDKLVSEGKLEGNFEDTKWMGYSGVKRYGIDFTLDKRLYDSHIGKELGISYETMGLMLRCYAIYITGIFVYSTISQIKISTIKRFLQEYKDKDLKLSSMEITTVEDFLAFISTPDHQINTLLVSIRFKESPIAGQRKLAPVVNYLVIQNEVNSIIQSGCDDETFKRWFPIYFWANITFILPLRATEMLLTPKKCIYRDRGKVYLKIRRTKLKKGFRTVYYDIDKDYKEFVYEIPDTEVVCNIEKYMEMTDSQDRRFLFEYDETTMINEMLSLAAFNRLLAAFVEENIIGNHKYDFAKYASGIDKFEPVTAGDSRPIAMANIYFQNFGEDICRQLADHTKIETSAGYYTNISETIWASSIVQLQKKLNYEQRYSQEQYEQGSRMLIETEKAACLSQKRMQDDENLDDCIEQGHLSDCMGCKYYRPTEKELESFLQSQKEKADDSAKRVIDFMNGILKIKNRETTLEEVFLSVQTEATRYRMGCDIKAREVMEKWQKLKSSQKINY